MAVQWQAARKILMFKIKSNAYLSNPLFVACVAVFCTLLWGSAFPAIKIGYEFFRIEENDIPSKLVFAGVRFFIAGAIVLLIGFLGSKPKPTIGRHDILPISFLSLFQTYGQYLLLYVGIVYITGTKSSLYTSVAAFTSVIASAFVFRGDNLNLKKIFGCIMGISGIVVMVFGGEMGKFSLVGDGLVILSNIFGGIGNVISKKIDKGRTPIQVSGWQLFIGGAALMLTGFIFGGSITFYNESCVEILIYLGVMAGSAFMLWTLLLFHNPVSRVAVYNLLIPVFGTMWSGILLGENIFTMRNLSALVLVCSGIFLVNSASKKSLNLK